MHVAPFYHRSIFHDLDDFDNLLCVSWPYWGYNPQQQQPQRRAAAPKKWSTTVALPGFRSNEMQIERSADNSTVKVLARRDEEGDFNEVRRTIQVPDNVDRSQLQVEFSREGALVAYAPLKQIEHSDGQRAGRRRGLDDVGGGTLMRQQNPEMQQLANSMWMLANESFPGSMESHVERGEDGSSCKLNLDFHLTGYKPEEIAVSHEGDHVTVEARHEARSEHGSSYKHFKRVFSLPKSVDGEKLRSRLLPDGRLRLEAPCSVDYAQQPALSDHEIKVKRATDK